MPELVEQMYCSQQIVIPPKFPYLLKRYCKAAIKTQPYDLLRWSFEYFRALSLRRPPPVKLRLEYPVFSTEGGLTRGCLKVIANQLAGMTIVSLSVLKATWQGFCLDPCELRRILCLCEVYMRAESMPFLEFIAVAAGLLTKSLTNTMILLCETLTKEPDGGSANIPVDDFIHMYKYIARVDASKNVNYLNGLREGATPEPEEAEQEEISSPSLISRSESSLSDFWDIQDESELMKLTITNDNVARTARLSVRLNQPVLGPIERSPSMERAAMIERENYMLDRRGKPPQKEEIEKKMEQLTQTIQAADEMIKEKAQKPKDEGADKEKDLVRIKVYNEEGDEVEDYEIFGEPKHDEDEDETPAFGFDDFGELTAARDTKQDEDPVVTEAQRIANFIAELAEDRENRIEDVMDTLLELEVAVNRYKSAHYDLGMVAGRQMSTTSGEFIVQSIEKHILAYIDEQIAILPDPDLKKRKAKPEEVAMVRDILEQFLDDNMDIIAKEEEVVEEEEEAIPEVTVVYAVPGIGPPVDEDIVADFVEYAREVSKVQCDVFMPRNIRHFLCPPLERFVEYNYDEGELEEEQEQPPKKEEVPTGGKITE